MHTFVHIHTWFSNISERRAWWTFSLVPKIGMTSFSQSGPGEDAMPTMMALPSRSCSKKHNDNRLAENNNTITFKTVNHDARKSLI